MEGVRSQAAAALRSLAKLVRLGDWMPSDLEDAANETGEALTAVLNAGADQPTARLIRGGMSHILQFTIDGRRNLLTAGLKLAEEYPSESGEALNPDRAARLIGLQDLTPSYCAVAASAFESLAGELAQRIDESPTPVSASAPVARPEWRARLQRAREAFLAHRDPRLAAALTLEPRSDTYHAPTSGNEWLKNRGYSVVIEPFPVRAPLDSEGWLGTIDVHADGGVPDPLKPEGSPAWRLLQRFRDDAARAVAAFNDAPAEIRAPYGGAAHPDADGWLALLFRAAWLLGKVEKSRCDDGEAYREGDAVAWFSCVTHLAEASVEFIDTVLATADAPTPMPLITPPVGHNSGDIHVSRESPLTAYVELLSWHADALEERIDRDAEALQLLAGDLEATVADRRVRLHWARVEEQDTGIVQPMPRIWTRLDQRVSDYLRNPQPGFHWGEAPTERVRRLDRFLKRIVPRQGFSPHDICFREAYHEARRDGTASVLCPLLDEAKGYYESMVKAAQAIGQRDGARRDFDVASQQIHRVWQQLAIRTKPPAEPTVMTTPAAAVTKQPAIIADEEQLDDFDAKCSRLWQDFTKDCKARNKRAMAAEVLTWARAEISWSTFIDDHSTDLYDDTVIYHAKRRHEAKNRARKHRSGANTHANEGVRTKRRGKKAK